MFYHIIYRLSTNILCYLKIIYSEIENRRDISRVLAVIYQLSQK